MGRHKKVKSIARKAKAPERTSGAPFVEATAGPTQNTTLAAASVEFALKFLGVKEATGHNDGAQVKVFQDYIGKWVEGQSWCAAFASYCIGETAAKLGIKTKFTKSASSTEIYHQAKSNGTLLAEPIPYCIGLSRGNGGTPGKDHHHTFRVLSVDKVAGIVHSLDGNYGNQVMKAAHPISNCDFVAVV